MGNLKIFFNIIQAKKTFFKHFINILKEFS